MDNLSIKQKLVGFLLALVALLGGGYSAVHLGAVDAGGNAYQSTTTPTVADRTNLCPAGFNASSTTGMLGTVNAFSGGTGELMILDATTSDVTLRTGNMSTTTLILAHYQTGFGTTTQTFDVAFSRGLFIDYTSGVASTSISYRCGSGA